jgi:hypothetical protein
MEQKELLVERWLNAAEKVWKSGTKDHELHFWDDGSPLQIAFFNLCHDFTQSHTCAELLDASCIDFNMTLDEWMQRCINDWHHRCIETLHLDDPSSLSIYVMKMQYNRYKQLNYYDYDPNNIDNSKKKKKVIYPSKRQVFDVLVSPPVPICTAAPRKKSCGKWFQSEFVAKEKGQIDVLDSMESPRCAKTKPGLLKRTKQSGLCLDENSDVSIDESPNQLQKERERIMRNNKTYLDSLDVGRFFSNKKIKREKNAVAE